MKKILVYGYGNPGRQDDGLGVLLSEMIEEWAIEQNLKENIDTDSNYQLNIEDAYKLNDYDLVIYADASIEEIESYLFEQIEPIINPQFTSHSVSPEFVIGLCKEIYGDIPTTYLMHIKGYEWEFLGEMTEKANANLNKAFEVVKDKINDILKA